MDVGHSRKFDAIRRGFSGPVFVIDADGRYREVIGGDRQQDLLYASPDSLQGKTFSDLFPAETAERFHETVRTALETGSPEVIEYELSVPAGDRWFEATISPIPPLDEPPEVVLWAARDISGRKQHERAVTALHETAVALHTGTSKQEICRETIHAAESILEFDQSVLALETDGELHVQETSGEFPDDRAPRIPIDEGVAGRTYRTGESVRIDDLREVEDAYAPGDYRACLSIPVGDHGNFQAVDEEPAAFDESDRELAELLLAQTAAALTQLEYERELERRNERLEEFANIVSHDLQTPLTVAQGRLEMARQECESDHLDDVRTAHDRMETLIEDLLALSRGRTVPLDREAVDLRSLVERCWATVAAGDAELVLEVDDEIRADRRQLRHVLENLFTNAVEHGGDDVTVTVGRLADGFYVADDGPGIPPEQREAVFEPGYSTATDGTGFGLRIVEQVVADHGWDIDVGAARTGGARFEITGIDMDGS